MEKGREGEWLRSADKGGIEGGRQGVRGNRREGKEGRGGKPWRQTGRQGGGRKEGGREGAGRGRGRRLMKMQGKVPRYNFLDCRGDGARNIGRLVDGRDARSLRA